MILIESQRTERGNNKGVKGGKPSPPRVVPKKFRMGSDIQDLKETSCKELTNGRAQNLKKGEKEKPPTESGLDQLSDGIIKERGKKH